MTCKVDSDIIEHALETDERIPPKKQKLRKMSKEKVKLKFKGRKTRK
jgi:hypothetical protein